MTKPLLDALQTPANGQIFALKKALSKAAVEAAFDSASEKASGRKLGRTIREKRTVNSEEFIASLICFPLTGAPTFLPGTDLEECTYGFLLLLEIQVNTQWFLGVFKHRAASLADWLDARVKPLPRSNLTNAFSDGSTVRKMSLQRLAPSKHELRAATYEGADLQSSLPMMAASRCAIRSIRFQGTAIGSIAVTLSTSRVQRSGGRCPVSDLAQLVNLVARQTQADKRHAFLATFAKEVAIADLPPGTQPTSVLFDWSAIIETDALELHRRPAPEEELGELLPKKLLQRVLGDTLPLIADGEDWQFEKIANRPRGKIARTATKYSVKTVLGNQVVVHDGKSDETIPLARWARENDAYSITFTQPEYCFAGGALYRRAAFTSEVDPVRRCLRPEAPLAAATSEKGEPKKNDTRFPTDSVFGIAEDSLYAQREWLCCTDLGDEWADYVCIDRNALRFIHCKGGKQTTGASSFQEVVGQGLKNLGRIQSTPSDFRNKLNATRRKKFWSATKIERLRDPVRKWSDFEAAVADLLANPDATKEVHLVVTMLSKAAFETAAAMPTPHFIQLVWLLASFINSCREMGAKPVIMCAP
jgi:hypothetical protein